MAKKIIKLTEGDIENIVKKVIEEQGYGGDRGTPSGALSKEEKKEIKQLRKDGTISRDEYKQLKNNPFRYSPSWEGKDSGILNFKAQNELYPVAINVSSYDFFIYYLTEISSIGKIITPPTPPTPPNEVITIPIYNVQGSSLPYADNMVMPYFDKYPEANVQFKKIVNDFIKYINAGGGDKLTNVTIKGSADSARPSLKWPSGYSKLDHPSAKPYNGKTDPKEMNQYLADMRANQYAQAVINAIKEETGFDLKIKVLKGDNFYGQGDGKRGEEFRKITLEPNAEQYEVVNKETIPGKGGTKAVNNKSTIKPYLVYIYPNGYANPTKIEGFKTKNGLVIKKEDADDLGLTGKFKTTSKAEIKGSNFFVDGKDIGPIRGKGDLDNVGIRRNALKGMSYNSILDGIGKIGEGKAFAGPRTITIGSPFKIDFNGEKIEVITLKQTLFSFHSNKIRG
jgi:hypothetical protein